MTWKDITIGKYQQLYTLLTRKVKTPLEELEQQLDLLVLLDGRTKEHYESLTRHQFITLIDYYSFVFTPPKMGDCPKTFVVSGIKFKIDYNPANIKYRLKARDVIDLTSIANEDGIIVANMNKILAAYCVPSRIMGVFKRKIDIEKHLLDLDIQTAYNITAFFLPLLEACLPIIVNYSEKEMEKLNQKVSTLIGDGTSHSTT